jgi:hypothetical protein
MVARKEDGMVVVFLKNATKILNFSEWIQLLILRYAAGNRLKPKIPALRRKRFRSGHEIA